MLVFFPQNKNQKNNFYLLCRYLVENNYLVAADIIFINIVGAFDDSADDSFKDFNEVKINWFGNCPIYKLSFSRRFFQLCINLRNLKKLCFIKKSTLIIGNDGTIQRFLINRFNPPKIFILCDTVIGPQKKILKLYRIFFLLFSFLKVSHFFPGLSFHTKCNGIFLNNARSKYLLRKRCVKSPIHVVEMPLHIKNKERFRILVSGSRNIDKNQNLLYITSAFNWHRKYQQNTYQKQDIADLIIFLRNNPSFNLKVRVHPRESVEDYLFLKNKSKIKLSISVPLVEDLAWCGKLVTAASSVAFESKYLGIQTYIYRKNFGPLPNDHLFLDGYKIIDDLNSLKYNHITSHKVIDGNSMKFISERILIGGS